MIYKITMIAAHDKNRVIGNNNEMLWHLPKDFAWFKKQTLGHDVVMGKNTMESITQFTKGKPLPERNNIVLSKTMKEKDGFTFYDNYESILRLSLKKEIIIIGGAKVYELFLPYANKLILTEIDKEFQGDAYFPQFNKDDFKVTFKQDEHEKDTAYSFVIYEK